MHTEHLQNVRLARVVAAWLVAAAVTSLAALALLSSGLLSDETTPSNTWWSIIAVAVGFFAGGLFAGFRAIEAPILHAFSIGMTSLVAWFLLNALASTLLPGWIWTGLTPQLALGILLMQFVASTVGALLGHNFALRGRPGLTEQEPSDALK
jgi:hypothetical protein